jgi:hypothetical protein
MVGRRLRWTGFALGFALAAAACGGQSRRHDEAGSGGTGDTGGAGLGGTAGWVPSAGTGGNKSGCIVDGVVVEIGGSFLAEDGCNTCVCLEAGHTTCTRMACTPCMDLLLRYERALIEAKRCDPRSAVEQCTLTAGSAIHCGCPVYVNDDEDLLRLSQQYQADRCSGPVACGACADPPLRGVCGADSFCSDVYTAP